MFCRIRAEYGPQKLRIRTLFRQCTEPTTFLFLFSSVKFIEYMIMVTKIIDGRASSQRLEIVISNLPVKEENKESFNAN